MSAEFLDLFRTPRNRYALLAVGMAYNLLAMVFVVFLWSTVAETIMPPAGDSSGIPVVNFWLFIFPVNVIVLIRGMRKYPGSISLFRKMHPGFRMRNPVAGILGLLPLLYFVSCVTMGLICGLVILPLFFLVGVYVQLLALRACTTIRIEDCDEDRYWRQTRTEAGGRAQAGKHEDDNPPSTPASPASGWRWIPPPK